jgi:hypothetical protein
MASVENHTRYPAHLATHSAQVDIALHVSGRQFRVAKLAPDRLYFDSPQLITDQTGTVIMHIDGQERRWNVTLLPTDAPSKTIQAQFAQT